MTLPCAVVPDELLQAGPAVRRSTVGVPVGRVQVGGGAPVVVQSMTNTDTADIAGTVRQVAALAPRGFRDRAHHGGPGRGPAAAVPHIHEKLLAMGLDVPLVGDFHYIGHKLLADHPACAEALAKYRINPGNVGFGDKKDRAVRCHRRDRHPPRQAGAHRRQLGVAGRRAADPPDGRECPPAPARRERAR